MYDECCGRLHRNTAQATTAEELMRSRYSAFVLGEADHLFRTWHPRTRPEEVHLDPSTRWTGLQVVETQAGGPDDESGVVEFVASFEGGRMQERSTFARRAGRWVYVDGVPGTRSSPPHVP